MDVGTDKTIMSSRIILVTRKPTLMLYYYTSAMRTSPKPTLVRPYRFRCRMTRTYCIQTDAEFGADIANGTEIVNTGINLGKELQKSQPKGIIKNTAILYTCSMIYGEALAVLYANTVFSFQLTHTEQLRKEPESLEQAAYSKSPSASRQALLSQPVYWISKSVPEVP